MSLEIYPSVDRKELERFFLKRPDAHIYALADLEDRFWPYVEACVAAEAGEITAAAFFFHRLATPILYCIAEPGDPAAIALLQAVAGNIPSPCFGHLGLGLAEVVDRPFRSSGTMVKMQLTQSSSRGDKPEVPMELLSTAHEEELATFYREQAYTETDLGGGFFDPYMLEIGPYYGIRQEGQLVAAGGVHVRSPRYGVAALGNIAVAPRYRGRGFGAALTRAICHTMQREIRTIGLNVHADNKAARKCYRQLGFEPVLEYEEGEFA